MNKRLIQIDHDTGEVVDGFVAYVVPKRKNGFQQGWLAMAQNGAEILAQSDLGANDFKVLMKLLSVLDYENLIQVSQADIARELDMHRQHVQRSIKRLIQLGIILEGVKMKALVARTDLTQALVGKAQLRATGRLCTST